MIFSVGFVRVQSLRMAFCPVDVVQCAMQEVAVAMPRLSDEDVPQ